jgi:seryl-tRNA synthetase
MSLFSWSSSAAKPETKDANARHHAMVYQVEYERLNTRFETEKNDRIEAQIAITRLVDDYTVQANGIHAKYQQELHEQRELAVQATQLAEQERNALNDKIAALEHDKVALSEKHDAQAAVLMQDMITLKEENETLKKEAAAADKHTEAIMQKIVNELYTSTNVTRADIEAAADRSTNVTRADIDTAADRVLKEFFKCFHKLDKKRLDAAICGKAMK